MPAADGYSNRPRPRFSSEDAIVAKFVSAWESADLDALVALLTDDVFMSMPPMPFEYEGRDAVARSAAASSARAGGSIGAHPGPMRQPAFGAYVRTRRRQPRRGPLRPRPHRRPDLRIDPL